MPNPFVHVELHTGDLAEARKFYSTLFAWNLEDVTMPDGSAYTMINVGEGTGGGMMTSPAPNAPSQWVAYVGVDDVEASTRRAEELGATIVQGVTQVGEYGWMSMIRDPTGAHLALWKNSPKK